MQDQSITNQCPIIRRAWYPGPHPTICGRPDGEPEPPKQPQSRPRNRAKLTKFPLSMAEECLGALLQSLSIDFRPRKQLDRRFHDDRHAFHPIFQSLQRLVGKPSSNQCPIIAGNPVNHPGKSLQGRHSIILVSLSINARGAVREWEVGVFVCTEASVGSDTLCVGIRTLAPNTTTHQRTDRPGERPTPWGAPSPGAGPAGPVRPHPPGASPVETCSLPRSILGGFKSALQQPRRSLDQHLNSASSPLHG